MRRSDFEYPLPPELIAQNPLPQRSASRLLCVDGARGCWVDRMMRELPALLVPGDLLVFNDTRVVPARLAGRKASGGRVEVLLERPLPGGRALVQLRASKPARAGTRIDTAGGELCVLGRSGDLWELQLPGPALAFFERHGSVPLPPYIARTADAADRERYQSLLARVPGAVAAPTASLHFDAPLLQALAAGGIGRATVTLHVGAGTFQPVRVADLDAHVMHAEWYEVSEATVAAVRSTQAAGQRVVAVGTTVARALESAAAGATLVAGGGDTALFVRPGYRFRVVDALLTNFHLPGSTLLMLVAAFAGRELTLAAYAHAVRERYRFFSYGDAMLVFPVAAVRA
ncbi:MAG: tRNA preQ1(34) S-adenosylmethionine ribosyltransferase-isomerase QueA [Gammaproteobacteria bacterium]|nr:tRNA preQ1(34) S-adenosylmethionine ribosyltransferase-isomerase QueA [Gammaproteobacteria bacterium]